MKIFNKLFKKNKKDKLQILIKAKLEGVEDIKNQIDELEKKLKNLKVIISVGDEYGTTNS